MATSAECRTTCCDEEQRLIMADSITVEVSGNFDNLERFLRGAQQKDYRRIFDMYGRRGVQALSSATPVDSGKTASMWDYEVHQTRSGAEIVWTNDNINKGVNIAIILQYGHGTKNGGYVQGRDYINPAIASIFDDMADDLWKAVSSNG